MKGLFGIFWAQDTQIYGAAFQLQSFSSHTLKIPVPVAENKGKQRHFSRNLLKCSFTGVTTSSYLSQAKFVVSVLPKTTSSHFSQPYSNLVSVKTSEGAGEVWQLPDPKTVHRAAMQGELSWPGSDFRSFQVLKIFTAGRCPGTAKKCSQLNPGPQTSHKVAQVSKSQFSSALVQSQPQCPTQEWIFPDFSLSLFCRRLTQSCAELPRPHSGLCGLYFCFVFFCPNTLNY